ncbi:MAG: hypothetical protein ACFFCS_01195 [Candidatus Hodarchaeota archaeon]
MSNTGSAGSPTENLAGCPLAIRGFDASIILTMGVKYYFKIYF